MTTEQPAITSASVILRFADGTTRYYDIHEGHTITATVANDEERHEDWLERAFRNTPYALTRPTRRIKVELTAISRGGDRFATVTTAPGSRE